VKRFLVLVVALAVVAAGCGNSASHTATPTTTAAPTTTTTASASASASSSASACSRPHASGQSAQSFSFEGTTRTYQLYVPAAYDGTRAVPVVFDFHGFGSNAVQQMAYGNFKPEADRDDFLIVAPNGQGAARAQHFNLTREPGAQNDVQMVGSLLDHIEATLCVDTKRVYATGMSTTAAP
jgi:poly(3-hydroxybutyrate) depolymerase